MQLQKEVKKEQNAKISVQVTVEKSAINETREEVINDFEKAAKVPGFRKGKVPRQIVLKRYSSDIKNETINTVLSRSIQQILKEEKFNPISDPVITEMGDLALDEDFSYKAEFDIMPEIPLGEYKGVSSEKYVYTVGEELVNREIENLRERFSTLTSIDEKAKVGDYIVIDYEEITPQGPRNQKKDQTVFLDLKDDQLAKQLLGLSKGDEKEIILTQPPMGEEKIEPESVRLHVKVNDLKKKELPELNDDFAQDISDVDSLDELKKKIRENLQMEAEHAAEEKTKTELLNKLLEKTKIELPETMLNTEVDRLLYEIISMYRLDFNAIQNDEQKYQEYRKKLTPQATQNLRQELILAEIARKEGIEVSDAEIDEEIREYAKNAKKDFEALKSSMVEEGSVRTLKYRLRIRKALDFLYEHAKLVREKKQKYGANEPEGGKK
jgi:trigger factor